MGVTVREKPKGSGVWWVFISHDGKRRSKHVGPDESLAREVAKKLRAKLILGQVGIVERQTKSPLFKDYADKWLNSYIKTLRRESTFERYGDILKRHVYPHLGNKRINDLRRGDIRDLLLKLLAGGLSRSSVCLVRDVISGPLNCAVDEEIIDANPVAGITKRLQLGKRRNIDIEPLTHEEVQVFLDACIKHAAPFYPFFLCAFRTGMRLGELLALKWGDIDWNGQFIRVARSYKVGRITDTKTGKSRRVDMSEQLSACLGALLTERKKEALKEGRSAPAEFIFHRGGKPIEQNYARTTFKRILSKAGLREIRVHDCRHTFASLLLTDGASPVYVKEQLGHSSIQMTVDIYGHLIPSANRQAVNRLDSSAAPSLHPA